MKVIIFEIIGVLCALFFWVVYFIARGVTNDVEKEAEKKENEWRSGFGEQYLDAHKKAQMKLINAIFYQLLFLLLALTFSALVGIIPFSPQFK